MMVRVVRTVGGLRLDHGLLVAGAGLMAIGSVMPWIEGSTRLNGYVDWTGLDDTGEGAMLIAAALAIVGWVRWRAALERELTARLRFLPLGIALACALLWVIAVRKMLYLSWFELDVGARPEAGLFVAAIGILVTAGGALLAATDPDSVAAAHAAADREKRRSGAGGVGAASDRFRRGGGGRPSEPGGYSVVARVDRASGRADGERDADRGRD